MSSFSSQPALKGGKGGGNKPGIAVEIDPNYDEDEEFSKPGHARGPEGSAGTRQGDLPKGGYAKGCVGSARAVNKKDKLSAQADGPCGYVGSGGNNKEVYLGVGGGLGGAEAHAGPLGVAVQGPGAEGNLQLGLDKGLKVGGGVNVAEGKVQVGPVKVGAGVGIKGAVQAGYGGFGAIVPGIGGAVFDKNKVEFAVGPFNLKIGR